MLRELLQKDKRLIETIKDHKNQNIYLYIDVMTYGFHNSQIRTYVSEIDGKALGIVYEYFGSLQLMTFGVVSETLVNDLVGFVSLNQNKRISGPKELIELLYKHVYAKYAITQGYIMKYTGEKAEISEETSFADAKDFPEIADLICNDRNLGKGYDYENILNQLILRYNYEECENMIIRHNGKIVSHVASYAVLPELVIVSGMVTAPSYRNLGYGSKLIRSFSSYLYQTGKLPVLYCYEEEYHSWYAKLGYDDIGLSAKLELI